MVGILLNRNPMSTRQLFLVSPYRLPSHSNPYLADDEVAAFLNGWAALWHPAALHGAGALPRVASPYDHEQPVRGHIYAVPECPALMLPDDWGQRVRDAGAVHFQAVADRRQTFENLHAALALLPPPALGEGGRGGEVAGSAEEPNPLTPFPIREGGTEPTSPPEGGEGDKSALPPLPNPLPPEQVSPFLGIGYGLLVLEALLEAMSHENVLSLTDLWIDIRAAVVALCGPEPQSFRQHLQAAADRMLAAREVAYQASLSVIDLTLVHPEKVDGSWPGAFEHQQPWNLLACGAWVEKLAQEHPEKATQLRDGLAQDRLEVIGGSYLEREDPLLPVESQLWNLLKGQAVYKDTLGREVRVFARRRSGFHPNLPQLLQQVGISRALLVPFDEAVLPSFRTPVTSWPSPDGKHVDGFTRTPLPTDSPQTFFQLAIHLYEPIMNDHTAAIAMVHRDRPAAPSYLDWLELTKFAPILGRWATLSTFFNDTYTGDYSSAGTPDEFHADYLSERTTSPEEAAPGVVLTPDAKDHPVSAFAVRSRGRRHIDAAWTFAGLLRALGERVPDQNGQPFETVLSAIEDRFESGLALTADELTAPQSQAAAALARRLCARGQENNPGYLVLNPCAFARRVTLELPNVAPSVGGAIKACQVDGMTTRLVLEVPSLGFAWVPRSSPTPASPPARMRLADDRCVRNEFLEAEVDPQTGGLRALRDPRTRVGRLGQQLVFNPGSTMKCEKIETTSTGPALGEIVSSGVLLDEKGEVIAQFRQRFRAWLGRPVLELRVEITPVKPPEGYAWHSYYGARFAWRDERSSLLRSCQGTATVTTHTRPETADFLEVRLGKQNAVIFPNGLPFHQRHKERMVDVILVPPGEKETAFDLTLGLDRETPAQTALGLVSPVAVVPIDRGPPHVGSSGWLFHLDASNLLLTSIRPVPGADDTPNRIIARLQELTEFGGPAILQCVRDPVNAVLVDARGEQQSELTVESDRVHLDVPRGELVQLRLGFR
jgi:Glycosyl hydrolases family 38 N-terminal domain